MSQGPIRNARLIKLCDRRAGYRRDSALSDGTWITTDEAHDVAGSIRHALRCFDFVGEDPQAWKCVVLALHGALQGACICHLTTTAAPIGAVTKKNAEEWLEYFEASRMRSDLKAPRTVLMTLPELLKAVRKPNSAGWGASREVEISDRELSWLKRIHDDLRNQFVHFEPKGWAIEVSGVPEVARLIARIVNDILDCGWAFRHLDEAELVSLRQSLNDLAGVKRLS